MQLETFTSDVDDTGWLGCRGAVLVLWASPSGNARTASSHAIMRFSEDTAYPEGLGISAGVGMIHNACNAHGQRSVVVSIATAGWQVVRYYVAD